MPTALDVIDHDPDGDAENHEDGTWAYTCAAYLPALYRVARNGIYHPWRYSQG